MNFIATYWYVPILLLIFITGVIYTIKLKGIQFRRVGKALKLMFKPSNEGAGEVSVF